jgi:hypothetical protein
VLDIIYGALYKDKIPLFLGMEVNIKSILFKGFKNYIFLVQILQSDSFMFWLDIIL